MSEQVLFGEFVDRWLSEVAPVRYKPTAVAEYASLLRLHLRPYFESVQLDRLTAQMVERYLAFMREQGFAPRSLRNHLTVLRAVLRTAEADGVVAHNAAAKVLPPRVERREQRFLTPEELHAVLSATSQPWAPLLALPIYTAARKGECLSLRWSSVSFEQRRISFVSSMRAGVEYSVKTAASRAPVAMAADLVPYLKRRQEQAVDPVAGYVFCKRDGRPLSDSAPGVALKKACLKAGIKPCGFHTLRHSAISALIATGAHPLVVSRFARHASIETTMDVYGHLMAPAGGDAVANLERLIHKS